MQVHELKKHVEHGWLVQTTDHIHNVEYLNTHYLMRCPCGFYGWLPFGEIDNGI